MSNVICPLTSGFSESKPEVFKFSSYVKLLKSTSTVPLLEKHTSENAFSHLPQILQKAY